MPSFDGQKVVNPQWMILIFGRCLLAMTRDLKFCGRFLRRLHRDLHQVATEWVVKMSSSEARKATVVVVSTNYRDSSSFEQVVQ
jgi:hypothetical protein